MSITEKNRKFKRKVEQIDPTNLDSHRNIKNKDFNIDNDTIKERKNKS